MNDIFRFDTKYEVRTTKKFRKDLKRIEKAGFGMQKLKEVILLLAQDQPLPERCNNHPLKGNREGQGECHVAPDWLLIYEKRKDLLLLLLLETGSHSRLLGK